MMLMSSVDGLFIVGPTATGKSDVAVELARIIDGEVISADSMQVYRGLDIGTAKVPASVRSEVAHHMIDIVEPTDIFTAHDYAVAARAAVDAIRSRGRIPIVVGGTGLYVRGLLNGFDFGAVGRDDALRAQLEQEARVAGAQALHARLRESNPEAAARIAVGDVRRIVRALELQLASEASKSGSAQSQTGQGGGSDLFANARIVGLCMQRERLYGRIESRVDAMVQQGLLNEVAGLLEQGCNASHTSMQAIGYKELIPVVAGTARLDEAVAVIKRQTRRYAKRQLSWFRTESRIVWYACPEDGMMIRTLAEQVAGECRGLLRR